MTKFNNERRIVLKGAAVAGIASSMPIAAGAALKPVVDGLERSEFPMPDFKSVEGDSVKLRSALGETMTAEIVEVSDMPFTCQAHVRPAHLRSCAKVVRFEVAGAADLESDLYQVSHSQLGKMELLMTSVPDAAGKVALEAVFN